MTGMIYPSMTVTRSDQCGNSKAIRPDSQEWATTIRKAVVQLKSAPGTDEPHYQNKYEVYVMTYQQSWRSRPFGLIGSSSLSPG